MLVENIAQHLCNQDSRLQSLPLSRSSSLLVSHSPHLLLTLLTFLGTPKQKQKPKGCINAMLFHCLCVPLRWIKPTKGVWISLPCSLKQTFFFFFFCIGSQQSLEMHYCHRRSCDIVQKVMFIGQCEKLTKPRFNNVAIPPPKWTESPKLLCVKTTTKEPLCITMFILQIQFICAVTFVSRWHTGQTIYNPSMITDLQFSLFSVLKSQYQNNYFLTID